MTISDEEMKDLKRLSKEFDVDFDELLQAYEKTSKQFDDNKKMDNEDEEKERLKKHKQEISKMIKKVLNPQKENETSNLDKAIKELTQRINKLRDDDKEEKIDDQVEILKQTKLMRQEGLLPPDSTKEED